MPETPDKSITQAVRNQVLLERIKAGALASFLPASKKLQKEMILRVLDVGEILKTKTQANELRSDLKKMVAATLTVQVDDKLMSLVEDVAVDQAEFMDMSLNTVTVDQEESGLGKEELIAALLLLPLSIEGLRFALLPDLLDDFKQTSVRRVDTIIRQGHSQGKAISKIATDFRNFIKTLEHNFRANSSTAIQHSASSSHIEVMKKKGAVSGYRWVSVLDGRTTQVCRGLSGRVFEFGRGPLPPIHWGCLLGGTRILAGGNVTNLTKREFKGKIVTIKTASGNVLSCTPNHPILSNQGWVAAEVLNRGDSVVSNIGGEWKSIGVKSKTNKGPPRFEDIFSSLSKSSHMLSRKMPTTSKDFHGDTSGGEVHVINPDSGLSLHFQTTLIHESKEVILKLRRVCHILFARFGLFNPSCNGHGFTNSRRMTFVEHGMTVRMRGILPALQHAFASCARKPVFTQDPIDRAGTDIQSLRQFFRGIPGKISLDNIISVEVSDFSGHVYNLQSEGGYIMANGIVTHNCRSTIAVSTNLSKLKSGLSTTGTVLPLSYYDWLKAQPKAFQDDAIGPARGKLFRDGGLSSKQFAKMSLDRNFEPLTLDEMKAKRPNVFEEAGL